MIHNDNTPLEVILLRKFSDENSNFISNWQTENPYKNISRKEHNEKFIKEYTEFIYSVREKYNLSDEDIKFWLTFY